MQTFKDNLDQEWNIHLDLPTARRIRSKLGIDLLRPDHLSATRASVMDRLLIIVLLCEPAAKELKIDLEDFEERLIGPETVNEVSNALMQELVDFSHRLGLVVESKMTEAELEIMKEAQKKSISDLATGRLDSVISLEKSKILQRLDAIVG